MKKREKELVKTERLTCPIAFDVLIDDKGEENNVVTPYNVFNAYSTLAPTKRKLEEITQEDVMIRRFALTKVFRNRVQFLFSNCFTNLNNRIASIKKSIDKANNKPVDDDNIYRHPRRYVYCSTNNPRYGMIFDLFSYAGFNNYITPTTYVDISNIIITEAYNSFIYSMEYDIMEYGYDILNNYTPCFMMFHEELLNMFMLIMEEVDNVYGPAGYNDLTLDQDKAELLVEMTDKNMDMTNNF